MNERGLHVVRPAAEPYRPAPADPLARLTRALAGGDAGTWEWNLSTGAARYDERWASILGYAVTELEPLDTGTVHRLADPADLAALEEAVARHLRGETHAFRATIRMRHRNGHWVWVLLRGRLATRTADGAPEWMSGLAFDDSDVKVAEEAMRTASHYARSLIEASVDPLITIAVDGRIMDVNKATEAATGCSRAELIGSDWSDYFTDPDRARAGYQQVFSTGRVVDYPLTLQHRSGDRMEVLYNASTFLDEDGRVAGVFAAARDVTEVRRTQAALEERNREVLLLSQMSDLLQSCQTVGESLPIVEAGLRALFPGSHGRGFIFNTSTSLLEETLSWGAWPAWGSPRGGAPVSTIAPGDCWALRRGAVHEFGLGEALNPPCHALPGEVRPYLCLPLLAQGTTLGIIHLVFDAEPADHDRLARLARATADSISLAVSNIRLRENLQALSTRDALTGLYNRRFLDEALTREISRARRSGERGVVAMIDIDHFKAFNDSFGHDAGDAVLVALAEQLARFRQGTDLPCRFGGEEFVLVLGNVSMEDAVRRLEWLRGSIARLRPLHNGLLLPGLTVSVGVAAFPSEGIDAVGLLKAADEALYEAKGAGRDCIRIAGAGGAAGEGGAAGDAGAREAAGEGAGSAGQASSG